MKPLLLLLLLAGCSAGTKDCGSVYDAYQRGFDDGWDANRVYFLPLSKTAQAIIAEARECTEQKRSRELEVKLYVAQTKIESLKWEIAHLKKRKP